MFKLSIAQIIAATEGRLAAGPAETKILGMSTDTRSLKPGELFVALRGEQFDGHDFLDKARVAGAGALLVDAWTSGETSDVPVIQVKDTLSALGDIAHAWRLLHPVPAIAITGTSGKTSTKNLIRDCLLAQYKVLATDGNFNNLIGLPKTLFRLDDAHEIAVLEMGMNRFGEIARMMNIAIPQYGLITNIGAGHTEGVGGIDGVAKAKGEMVEGLGEAGCFFANAEDERVMDLLDTFEGDVISYGFSSDCDVSAHKLKSDARGMTFEVKTPWESGVVRSAFWGPHQVVNALAAIAVAQSFQVPLATCIDVIEKVEAPRGRGRIVNLRPDIRLLDDAYNANPLSVLALMPWFENLPSVFTKKAFAFGTMKELGDRAQEEHLVIIDACRAAGVTDLYLFGEFASVMRDRALSLGYEKAHVRTFETVEEMAQALKGDLVSGTALAVKASHSCGFDKIVQSLGE